VLEANEYGKIDRVIWYDQEALIISGHGRRVRSLRYTDGLELWQLAATTAIVSQHDSPLKSQQVIQDRFEPGESFV
jgi:hypothetical protein